MANKSEKLTVRQRVHEVVRLRLDGARYPDIVQYASAQGWGVGPRMLRKYQERADLLILLQRDNDREKLFARREAQLERLFAKAVRDHDLGTGLAVLKELAKLQGLYPEQRVAVRQVGPPRDRDPDEMGYEELVEHVARETGIPRSALSDEVLERLARGEPAGRAAGPTFEALEKLDPARLMPPG
ncbi:MAG: hypothetical protein C0501_28190 [Isosphaera sp.]|nr:hypothetical protein [Isosphaera sp.]